MSFSIDMNLLFQGFVPGPPFLFGALLVFIALFVNMSLPTGKKILLRRHGGKTPALSSPTSSTASMHLDTTALLMADEKE